MAGAAVMDPHQSSGQSPIIMFMRGLCTEVGLVASKNRPVEQTQVWVAADVIEPAGSSCEAVEQDLD